MVLLCLVGTVFHSYVKLLLYLEHMLKAGVF